VTLEVGAFGREVLDLDDVAPGLEEVARVFDRRVLLR
jgi:hypothetical protein